MTNCTNARPADGPMSQLYEASGPCLCSNFATDVWTFGPDLVGHLTYIYIAIMVKIHANILITPV